MSNWSALTFGGWDPLGTMGESQTSFAWNGKDLRRNVRYQKKLIRFQNQQNREQASWSAKEMPSLQMAGLSQAGLNPILAVTGSGGFHTDSAASASSANVPSSESFVSGDHTSIKGPSSVSEFTNAFLPSKTTKKVVEGEVSSRLAEGKATQAESALREKKAKLESSFLNQLFNLRLSKLRADKESAENSATSSGWNAFLDQTRYDFFRSWLSSREPDLDEALKNYLNLSVYPHSSFTVHGQDNEFLRALVGAQYNKLRSEDWRFFRDQLNATSNSAKSVFDVLPIRRLFKGK